MTRNLSGLQSLVIKGYCNTCSRCHRAAMDPVAVMRLCQQVTSRSTMMRFKTWLYHERCIPSAQFHALAGSLPANHGDSGGSLLRQHAPDVPMVIIGAYGQRFMFPRWALRQHTVLEKSWPAIRVD